MYVLVNSSEIKIERLINEFILDLIFEGRDDLFLYLIIYVIILSLVLVYIGLIGDKDYVVGVTDFGGEIDFIEDSYEDLSVFMRDLHFEVV